MRFAVKFLGCKVSHADAMLARQRLLEAGHEEVPEAEAQLHVINTCCITSEAEAKSRQSVRRSLKTAREVYVGGCAVVGHDDGVGLGALAGLRDLVGPDPDLTGLGGDLDQLEYLVGDVGGGFESYVDRSRHRFPRVSGTPSTGVLGSRARPSYGRLYLTDRP
jgi:hypothetical protein